MSNQTQRLKLTQLAASIAFVAGGAAFLPSAHAAAPSAGTNISNIASASYTDSNGSNKTVTSNVVSTTVLQVASFTLIADQTKTANANGQVSLSHTLTNTGNGSDTFNVAVVNNDTRDNTTDNFDFSGLNVYLDANKDGVPDSQTPVTSVTLAAGQSVNLIVQATTASNNVTAGDLGKLTVSAISGFDTSVTAKNVDTVKITNGAVISLLKSASVSNVDATSSSPAAREVEYTLAYQNTGNTTATNVTITDVLPSSLTYVAGSATVNGTAVSDAADADGYNFTSGTATLVIPTVVANSSGVLKFKVRVNQNTPAGIIRNIAEVDPDGPGAEVKTPSNPNDVTVLGVKKGTINDSTIDAFADGQASTAPADDVITKSTTQGTPVTFGVTAGGGEPIVVHNTGNVTEAFNISVNKNSLPTGSIVELFKADGVTPLTDTNGDGVADTGPIASGATYQVVAKVTLPSSYSSTTPISTILTSTPVTNSTGTDTINLVIDKVVASTVDLHNGDATNSTGTVVGASGKDTGQFIDTKSTKPGQATNFPLTIDNKGATGDNYNLSTSPTLPTGWTVQYYLADGAGNPTGAPITNTGNIPSGGSVKLVAVVTPPANAPAGDQEVIFKVSSPATGLTDVMSDRVTVETNRILSLQNDRTGQVAPGGTVVYKHTLTNNGNIAEGATTGSLPFTLTNDQAANGWVTTLYVDSNNDGIADAGELVTGSDLAVKTGSIARGASVNLLIKVQAPTNATAGTPSAVVLTIKPTVVGGQSVADLVNTDLTTVTSGQVRLVKEQSLANCLTGVAGTYTQNAVYAKPGECVKYRITATNEGNADVTNVVISDATPAYTTLKVIASASPVATNATLSTSTAALTDGSTGTIAAEKTPLVPNTSAVLEFVIKVNN
ncbi:NEW3 domain-containing protein [Acinetobacter junii]|uniref:beta strand repeat-containing protein n=1 Tax=Acinetobacter junii TaxID=40215 RepID=UPI0024499C2B|nr:NEW3 domain-containing protein [Acinetobacter junii]MDH1377385.1 NEW3 domain-containing protein [Acinetobacter junii]MDH1857957.1 NEW3 domain-containing protein [Acinetobacter junii]